MSAWVGGVLPAACRIADPLNLENKWLARTIASITAGASSTFVTNPIWVVKTRLMSQVSARASPEHRPPWHYKNTFDAFRKMYTTEGIRSFYSGLSPALLGLTHVAIQFPLYEFLKMKFTGLEMARQAEGWKKYTGWASWQQLCSAKSVRQQQHTLTRSCARDCKLSNDLYHPHHMIMYHFKVGDMV